LTEQELDFIRAFNFKVDTCSPDNTFEKLSHTFPALSNLPSLAAIQVQMARLSGLQPVYYDCCINSCCCFAGPFTDINRCPFPECGEPRYDSTTGKSRKRFSYLPFTDCLVQLFASKEKADILNYHNSFKYNPAKVIDVFSSLRYQVLLGEPVMVAGKKLGHRFFSDERDIVMGLAIDGFSPFRNRKQTC
ncbi:hypothetical protein BOTBODRAFT_84791, partial [Botryobasidium botryosum FD-172 SS1]